MEYKFTQTHDGYYTILSEEQQIQIKGDENALSFQTGNKVDFSYQHISSIQDDCCHLKSFSHKFYDLYF